jgi:hypothetical protein
MLFALSVWLTVTELLEEYLDGKRPKHYEDPHYVRSTSSDTFPFLGPVTNRNNILILHVLNTRVPVTSNKIISRIIMEWLMTKV